MRGRDGWALAYARQADADFRAWELYARHPEALAAECHRLLFPQMACEKLCKARLVGSGSTPRDLHSSHGFTAANLPIVVTRHIVETGGDPDRLRPVQAFVRRLAREIELLNPAVRRGGSRSDNCEYPWEYGGRIVSPLDWSFAPSSLVEAPLGRTFVKLLKGAIANTLEELENST